MTTYSKKTEDSKKKLLGYNLADGKVGSETRGALARPSPPEKHALFTAVSRGGGAGSIELSASQEVRGRRLRAEPEPELGGATTFAATGTAAARFERFLGLPLGLACRTAAAGSATASSRRTKRAGDSGPATPRALSGTAPPTSQRCSRRKK